jgi:hypothetical protein
LTLHGVKRIGLDSKIPNIVNIEASPKLSNVSDNEENGEETIETCPKIGRINQARKFNTDVPDNLNKGASLPGLTKFEDKKEDAGKITKIVKQKSL